MDTDATVGKVIFAVFSQLVLTKILIKKKKNFRSIQMANVWLQAFDKSFAKG